MANTKFSDLPAGAAIGGTEEIPAIQSGAGVTVTPAQMATYVNKIGPFYANASPAPATGFAGYGMKSFAGAYMPTVKGSNTMERMVRPMEGMTRISSMTGFAGGTTIGAGNYHFQATYMTLTGATGWAVANTNYVTRQNATQFSSSAAAGNYAGFYSNNVISTQMYLGDGAGLGGFLFGLRFVIADTIAGAVMFCGISSSTSAPTGTTDPAALTNSIGVAKLAGSANLQIVFGGSGAQTPIDLGAGFPATGVKTDVYELQLFSDANDNGSVGYRVIRNPGLPTATEVSGTLTNTTPGTTLPASTTGLGPRMWRGNNATATAAVIALVSGYCISDT